MTTEDKKEKTGTRCGFVAVVGLPNAGKSTLVNAMVGEKVSIVSKKSQTTRSRVLGIAMQGQTQIVLIDTPGIFSPGKLFEKAMVRAAYDSLDQADIIIHIVDAAMRDVAHKNKELSEKFPEKAKCVLVLNKVDRARKPELLALAKKMNEQYPYKATYMISALKNGGVKDIVEDLSKALPSGPWHYDAEQITDISDRMMAAEITREKIYEQLHEELPYSIMVETEMWENFRNGDIKIDQLIYVQKESQKAIVLGKGGDRIRQIREAALKDMQDQFGTRVHLKLFVKVQEDWPERSENFEAIGLRFSA